MLSWMLLVSLIHRSRTMKVNLHSVVLDLGSWFLCMKETNWIHILRGDDTCMSSIARGYRTDQELHLGCGKCKTKKFWIGSCRTRQLEKAFLGLELDHQLSFSFWMFMVYTIINISHFLEQKCQSDITQYHKICEEKNCRIFPFQLLFTVLFFALLTNLFFITSILSLNIFLSSLC